MSEKKLYRTRTNRMLAGVCSGLSAYFQVDVSIVRLLWVFITFLGGSGILIYILCWLIIPEEPFYPYAG